MDKKTVDRIGLAGLAGIGGFMGYLYAGLFTFSVPLGIVCGALLLPGFVLTAGKEE